MGDINIEITDFCRVVSLFANNDLDGLESMERINQYAFYEIGTKLKSLEKYKDYQNPIPAGVAFFDVYIATNTMQALLKGVPIPLGVSKASAEALYTALDSIMEEHFRKEDENGNKSLNFPDETAKPISQWRLHHICSTILPTFETVFREEMREAATYRVPQRGIYNTPQLVDSAHEAFPDELMSFVAEKSKDDWKAAGRCLAFGLYSASGFHVARAVEGTLETYYQLFCNAPGKTLRGWQDYYDALEKARKSGQTPIPSEKVLAELIQMKDDYRNPLMHPRVILHEADAHMLFMNGASLIIAMAQEIKTAQSSGIQAPLALVPGSAVAP